MQREESRKAHRREVERRAEAVEAAVTSLRQELGAAGEEASSLRNEVAALREAAAETARFAQRLRDAEDGLTRAKEVAHDAVERRNFWRQKFDAEFRSRAVALQERDDAVRRAATAEGLLAPVRNERDLARREIIDLRSSLGTVDNRVKRLQEDKKKDASTMDRLRDERS
jgi:DNA repair exonuclease SbcCD ATPase subunit